MLIHLVNKETHPPNYAIGNGFYMWWDTSCYSSEYTAGSEEWEVPTDIVVHVIVYFNYIFWLITLS